MDWLRQKFELSRGGEAGNVSPMEGMRGLAVFLVFLVHYVTLIDPWIEKRRLAYLFISSLHSIGNVGVDLFFVLSGYLIYGSLITRHQEFIAFMRRRVRRIYPTFMVVFAVYIALSFVFSSDSKIPREAFIAAVYLTQNFLLLPGLFPIEPMITVAWSLSYEMFYYITVPVIIAVFALRQQSPIRRIFFFMTVVSGSVAYCALYGGHVRLIMFIAGILIYEVISHRRDNIPSNSVALLALILGLLSPLISLPITSGYAIKISILFACFFTVCLTCLGKPSSGIARVFSWTPLRWLGNMSYSYYLIHGLTLKAVFLILPVIVKSTDHGFLFFVTLQPLAFSITLVTSAVLFLTVERPYSLVQHADGLMPQNARRGAI